MHAVGLPLVIVVQIAQLVVLGVLVRLVLQLRATAARNPLDQMSSLSGQLEPLLKRIFGQVEAERRRLSELVATAERLVAELPRAEPGAATAEPDESERLLAARREARRLLAEGRPVTEAAAATGVPAGEVQVMANLLAARGEAEAAGLAAETPATGLKDALEASIES